MLFFVVCVYKREKARIKHEENAKEMRKAVVFSTRVWYTNGEVMIMTLKDLRVSKGLSQAACAAYLGMSTRNYQNYENDPKKANTAKYNAIYQKLEAYGRGTPVSADVSMVGNFNTNVITEVGL